MSSPIDVTLDAVIVAVTDDRPRILTLAGPTGPPRIPSGPLDPEHDKTLEQAMRRWIDQLAGVSIGYAEQLYTFGDRTRGSLRHDPARWLSVGYLALVREEAPAPGAQWVDVYDLFPWEDHREGRSRRRSTRCCCRRSTIGRRQTTQRRRRAGGSGSR